MKKLMILCLASSQLLAAEHAWAQANADILVVMKPQNGQLSTHQADSRFKTGANTLLANMTNAGFDIKAAKGFQPTRHILKNQLLKWQVPQSQMNAVLARLNRDPKVAFAEPDYTVYLDDYQYTGEALNKPNDEFFDNLWGLHNEGQSSGSKAGADIDALRAWETTTGSYEIAVGVIDTGIDFNHPDLVDNMWVNPNEIPGDGIDNDNNGYVDDIHGIAPYENSGDPMDTHSHGTHVAGTIGATGNNGIGVTGVNHKVSLIACKFIKPSGGGSISDAIKCLDYFIDLKQAGTDVRLTNNSWGGGSRSEAMVAALQRSHDAGMLFVSSAGNLGDDNDEVAHYPSSYDNVDSILAVAATTSGDYKSGFSNYGKQSVDVGAPGSGIYSTMPGGRYGNKSGTSMASPHAAGVAALILSANPGLSNVEVKALMMETGEALESLANTTVSGKRINAANAIEAASVPTWYLRTENARQTVKQGQSAQFNFVLQSINDWQGSVELSVAGDLPATLSDVVLSGGEAANLSIETTENTPVGSYQVVLSAGDGELVRTQRFSVQVEHANLDTLTFANTEMVAIPDNDPQGVRSNIDVADDLNLLSGEVSVDITHTWRGDLVVTLEMPDGRSKTLHDREGGSAKDLKKTWPLEGLAGSSQGTWHLWVKDLAGNDVGTINQWTLKLTGTSAGQDPVTIPEAAFVYDEDSTKVRFTDQSSDVGQDIIGWDWHFGDGHTSSEQNPSHSYANAGSYQVSLTVTDRQGNTDTVTKQVNVSGFTISLVQQSRLDNGDVRLRFAFAGSDAIFLYLYRDDRYLRSVFNTGDTTEILSNPQTGSAFSYKVCDSKGCSNDLQIIIQ